jgi:hypothetical protein
MKFALIVRNRVASVAGLDAPAASEILHVEIKDHYAVGDVIGVWPIYSFGEDEIIVGRNNKHLDFRLSVLKVLDGDKASVIVSTICTVHNLSGKLYLFFVVPFHRRGVRKLERFPLGLNRDSQAGRKGGVLACDSVSGMRHDQAIFDGSAGACG